MDSQLSRRSVLGGLVTTAAIPLLSSQVLAQVVSPQFVRAVTQALPRVKHAAAPLSDGRILVTGGFLPNGRGLQQMACDAAQIYDSINNEWLDVAPMLSARGNHASVALPDGRVAVIGGYSNVALDSVEIYDPSRDRWSAGPSLPAPIYGHTAVVAGSSIVVQGGGIGLDTFIMPLAPSANFARP